MNFQVRYSSWADRIGSYKLNPAEVTMTVQNYVYSSCAFSMRIPGVMGVYL